MTASAVAAHSINAEDQLVACRAFPRGGGGDPRHRVVVQRLGSGDLVAAFERNVRGDDGSLQTRRELRGRSSRRAAAFARTTAGSSGSVPISRPPAAAWSRTARSASARAVSANATAATAQLSSIGRLVGVAYCRVGSIGGGAAW